MNRRWKTSDIPDEVVCRAYLPQMARRDAEHAADLQRTLGDILDAAFSRCASENAEPEPVFADTILQSDTGAPWKVVYSAMHRAARRDLIDYGVTLRSGWLTDKGKALIA